MKKNIEKKSEEFSRTNVFRMKAFYDTYCNIRTAARELYNLPILTIPWGHNVVILQKIRDTKERLWYAQNSIEYGCNRSTL